MVAGSIDSSHSWRYHARETKPRSFISRKAEAIYRFASFGPWGTGLLKLCAQCVHPDAILKKYLWKTPVPVFFSMEPWMFQGTKRRPVGAPSTTTFPLLPALYIRVLFKISGVFLCLKSIDVNCSPNYSFLGPHLDLNNNPRRRGSSVDAVHA